MANEQVPEATQRTLQYLYLENTGQEQEQEQQAILLNLNNNNDNNNNRPIFLPESQSIVPNDGAWCQPPRKTIIITDHLGELVRSAQKTAESHCYASLAAGQTSESDEFGDVGVWLGDGNYGRGHEKEILNRLGLVAWVDAEIEQVDLETRTIVGKVLEGLEDLHRFFARREDSYFACFIVGRLKTEEEGGGWCGLELLSMDTTSEDLETASASASTLDRIQTLTDFHSRFQSLRNIPSLLLRPPPGSSLSHAPEFPSPFDPTDHDFAAPFQTTPEHHFHALKAIADALCSEKIQEALKVARESEDADQSDLGASFHRDSNRIQQQQLQQQTRSLSPVGSPQPYIPPPPRTSSLFPPFEDQDHAEPPRLRAEELVQYIREFNKKGAVGVGGGVGFRETKPSASDESRTKPKYGLYVWSRTRMAPPRSQQQQQPFKQAMNSGDGDGGGGLKLTSPVILRFTIADVLTAYISLAFDHLEDPLLVESVSAFGPREMKLPHMQSDYLVFQVLSQHVAKMVQSHSQVPLQTLIHLLMSYQGLFVDRCTSCERVLSAEGHVPPAGRVWMPSLGTRETIDPNGNDTDQAGIIHREAASASDHGRGHWEARHVTCMYS